MKKCPVCKRNIGEIETGFYKCLCGYTDITANAKEEGIKQYSRAKVVENYYRASTALMEIGTAENIPAELELLAIKASAATLRIIDFINSHKE
jgi:hypothetical protein